MSRIEDLIESYSKHIASPWARTVAGAQRVVMVVYDKEMERTIRARLGEFELKTKAANHNWILIDITNIFAKWISQDEYKDSYFESPEDLQLKLEAEFPDFVADHIRQVLKSTEATDETVVALLGVSSLFGFARVSNILKLVESEIQGRLLVFYPGQYENNQYYLLDNKDGWNYMAVPITRAGAGSNA